MDSYIVYQIKRYDIKGKQYLKTLGKYYIVDIGLRNVLLGNPGKDIGHVLKNVVYLELIRRGYDVYLSKVDDFVVNFVVKDEKVTKYIQVAASVRDDNTFNR